MHPGERSDLLWVVSSLRGFIPIPKNAVGGGKKRCANMQTQQQLPAGKDAA